MKRIIIALFLVLFCGASVSAQMRGDRMSNAPSPFCHDSSGALTPCNGESLAIPSTDPSTITSLESGTSLYAINGDTTISSASQLNRVYTLGNLATSPIVKITVAIDSNSTYWIGFKNVTDNNTTAEAVGVSVWCTQNQIAAGTGVDHATGSTVFVTPGVSGVTRFELHAKAVTGVSSAATKKIWQVSAAAVPVYVVP